MKVLACNAPFNEGGIGKFFADLVEDARRDQTLDHYFSSAPKTGDAAGRAISLQAWRPLFRAPWLRHNLAGRELLSANLFDRAVVNQLTRATTFVGFSGRTLRSFQRARKIGYDQLVLESATSHIANVRKRHQRALEQFPIEGSWLGDAQFRKTLREYEIADRIVVTSEYSMQSFLEAGVDAAKLERRFQSVAPRFAPPPLASSPQNTASEKFTVVYVGRLEATKGVPLLLEAFAHLPSDAALILVGHPASDAMEQLIKEKQAADARISVGSGDPLPFLHRADVFVHPSFEDGLALAPLEALACGVPVIVTEDTGMKEFVVAGVNGEIVPTGDVDALVEALRAMMQRPRKGTFTPFSSALLSQN